MKSVHLKMKITRQDLDAVWGHLEEALRFYKVTPELTAEVKSAFYSVESDVVTAR